MRQQHRVGPAPPQSCTASDHGPASNRCVSRCVGTARRRAQAARLETATTRIHAAAEATTSECRTRPAPPSWARAVADHEHVGGVDARGPRGRAQRSQGRASAHRARTTAPRTRRANVESPAASNSGRRFTWMSDSTTMRQPRSCSARMVSCTSGKNGCIAESKSSTVERVGELGVEPRQPEPHHQRGEMLVCGAVECPPAVDDLGQRFRLIQARADLHDFAGLRHPIQARERLLDPLRRRRIVHEDPTPVEQDGADRHVGCCCAA